MDLTDIYRTFHPNRKEYTFFSAAHGTFSKIDHIFGNKANLHRYKKILVITCVLSDHHGIKLEFNNNSNTRKPTNAWKLNSQLLNHPWVKEEIKKEIKVFLEFNENKDRTYSFMGHSENSAKRKVHSTKCPIKENREGKYWRLNSTHKSSRKKRSRLSQEE